MFSPQVLSLDQRIQKAISSLPPAHRLPPEVRSKESFGSQDEAKLCYQNWAFTQGFAIVVKKNDIKGGVYVLECSRHKKETKIVGKKI